MQPLLSIITINYNNIKGLEQTIKSVAAQKIKGLEYIITDGGSTDGSVAIINSYTDYITSWTSEPDRGIYHAMNKSIQRSSGKYLLFLNSGDELLEDGTLEKAMQELDGTDLITCNLKVMFDPPYVKIYPEFPTFQYFLKDTFPHPATFINRRLFELTNGYNENFKIVSDWEFFMLALFRHGATHKHLNLVLSRFYLDGISSLKDNISVIAREKAQAISKHFSRFNDILEDQKEYKKLKFIFDNSRLIKIAKWLGFLKFPDSHKDVTL